MTMVHTEGPGPVSATDAARRVGIPAARREPVNVPTPAPGGLPAHRSPRHARNLDQLAAGLSRAGLIVGGHRLPVHPGDEDEGTAVTPAVPATSQTRPTEAPRPPAKSWSVGFASASTQRVVTELPSELVRRLRRAAADARTSLPNLISELLTESLPGRADGTRGDAGAVPPLVRVTAMGPALEYWQAMGAELLHGDAEADRCVLDLGGSHFVLLLADGSAG